MTVLVYLLITIVVIWTTIATIVDLKKREVPDWISFSLIAIVLVLRLLFSIIESNYSYILYGLMYLGIFFLLAHLMYYARVFAGGDAKLLIGTGTALAAPPVLATSNLIPLPFAFVVNLMVVGAIYGIIVIIIYSIKNRKEFVKEFSSNNEKLQFKFLLIPYIYSAIKAIEKSSLILLVHPNKLTEGDWLAKTVKVQGRIIKPTWDGLNKKELLLLQKQKKKVLVKYGIPFVPAFLIALIITLIFGNLFELLFTAFL